MASCNIDDNTLCATGPLLPLTIVVAKGQSLGLEMIFLET